MVCKYVFNLINKTLKKKDNYIDKTKFCINENDSVYYNT